MAITFKAADDFGSVHSESTSFSDSITVPSGTNMLIVCVFNEANWPAEPTATFDGDSLTQQYFYRENSGGLGYLFRCGFSILTLADPTATTADLVVTSSNSEYMHVHWLCYEGVDTTTPITYDSQTIGTEPESLYPSESGTQIALVAGFQNEYYLPSRSGGTSRTFRGGSSSYEFASWTMQGGCYASVSGTNMSEMWLVGFFVNEQTSVDYALDVSQGSFSMTGQATSYAVLLAALYESYLLSGQAATLPVDYTTTASHDTYALTGQDVSGSLARVLAAANDALAISGQGAGLSWGQVMDAIAGQYTLSGQGVTAGITAPKIMAAYGAVALSGQTVTMLLNRVAAAASGEVSLAGFDTILRTDVLDLPPERRTFGVDSQGRIYVVQTQARRWTLAGHDRIMKIQ